MNDPGHPVKVTNFAELRDILAGPSQARTLDLDRFNDTEKNILEAAEGRILTGPELLKAAGYPDTGYYRGVLSNLRKAGALDLETKGYFRPDLKATGKV